MCLLNYLLTYLLTYLLIDRVAAAAAAAAAVSISVCQFSVNYSGLNCRSKTFYRPDAHPDRRPANILRLKALKG